MVQITIAQITIEEGVRKQALHFLLETLIGTFKKFKSGRCRKVKIYVILWANYTHFRKIIIITDKPHYEEGTTTRFRRPQNRASGRI